MTLAHSFQCPVQTSSTASISGIPDHVPALIGIGRCQRSSSHLPTRLVRGKARRLLDRARGNIKEAEAIMGNSSPAMVIGVLLTVLYLTFQTNAVSVRRQRRYLSICKCLHYDSSALTCSWWSGLAGENPFIITGRGNGRWPSLGAAANILLDPILFRKLHMWESAGGAATNSYRSFSPLSGFAVFNQDKTILETETFFHASFRTEKPENRRSRSVRFYADGDHQLHRPDCSNATYRYTARSLRRRYDRYQLHPWNCNASGNRRHRAQPVPASIVSKNTDALKRRSVFNFYGNFDTNQTPLIASDGARHSLIRIFNQDAELIASIQDPLYFSIFMMSSNSPTVDFVGVQNRSFLFWKNHRRPLTTHGQACSEWAPPRIRRRTDFQPTGELACFGTDAFGRS